MTSRTESAALLHKIYKDHLQQILRKLKEYEARGEREAASLPALKTSENLFSDAVLGCFRKASQQKDIPTSKSSGLNEYFFSFLSR